LTTTSKEKLLGDELNLADYTSPDAMSGKDETTAEAGVRLSEVARQVPASEIDRITGRLPPTQVNLNFIKTLEKIPGSIPAPTHPEFDIRGLGEVLPTWYVDELWKRPFPIPDPKEAAIISSEPSDFSLEGQPKSYGRFMVQRPTVPDGFGEILTAYSREVVRYQVKGVEMTNLFSAIFFRELVRMRGISFRDQLKHDIELDELRREREALTRGKIYRGRTGVTHLVNAHKHQDFETLKTNFESSSSSSSSSSNSTSSSSRSTPTKSDEAAEDGVVAEESESAVDQDARSSAGKSRGVSSDSESDEKSGLAKDPGEAVAKEFRDVLKEKNAMEAEYDPDNEYSIPKAKTIVTPGTLKKEENLASLICTRQTCKSGEECLVCKDAKCCGDCGGKSERKSRTQQPPFKKAVKRCKKCGNPIKPPPTLKELGICEPETCGTEFVCGGDCCAACDGIPPKCDPATCGEELDCFGKPLVEKNEQPEVVDESLAMGEHICKSTTCGNRIQDDGAPAAKTATDCCKMCSKPIAVKCDPSTCGESEEMTCEDCLNGCCGKVDPNSKCGTCGIVGGGNRACGDCGGGPGGPTPEGVICGKSVCGKEVQCIECGGVLCKDDTCGNKDFEKRGESDEKSSSPKCRKCLKKRLLAADCTRKTCPVCSGAPGKDGKVPTCCKKCVRQESMEDLSKKKSDSEIPPNIKRLVLHGWESDPDAPDDDDEEATDAAKAGAASTKSAPAGTVDAMGDVGGLVNAYCVPGSGCRNRCGICSDCSDKKNTNNNRAKGGILRSGLDDRLDHPHPPDASYNVSANCDVPIGGLTCTAAECGKTTMCHKCHGGRDDRPEACPVCHPRRLTCGPGVCQVLIDCGACCEPTPEFKAAFPKLAYSGVGPFQLALCGPIAGKIAAKKLGLECKLPSPTIEDKVDDRWFEPDAEAERRRLEKLRQKQLALLEQNFTCERLFGRRFSGATCGVAEWRTELQNAIGSARKGSADKKSEQRASTSPRLSSPTKKEDSNLSVKSDDAAAEFPPEASQPVVETETEPQVEEEAAAKSEETNTEEKVEGGEQVEGETTAEESGQEAEARGESGEEAVNDDGEAGVDGAAEANEAVEAGEGEGVAEEGEVDEGGATAVEEGESNIPEDQD